MTSTVLVNISDMIDLAIGTPEVGVVDFNMLQTVLHCLAQQLRILGKNVELRGSVAALPMSRENAQTIAISEYLVDTDQDKKDDVSLQPAKSDQNTILVVERVRKTASYQGKTPLREVSPAPSGATTTTTVTSTAHRTSMHTTHMGGDRITLVTLSKFELLENTVNDLKHTVYGALPKNEDIIREVRSHTNVRAIADMWTNLNVSSRLEAAEAGLGKLSSLVQDLINEMADVQDTMFNHGMPTSLGSVGRVGLVQGAPGAAGAAGAPGGAGGFGGVGGAGSAGGAGGVGGVGTPGGAGAPGGLGAAGGAGQAPDYVAGEVNIIRTDVEQVKLETKWLMDTMNTLLSDLQAAQTQGGGGFAVPGTTGGGGFGVPGTPGAAGVAGAVGAAGAAGAAGATAEAAGATAGAAGAAGVSGRDGLSGPGGPGGAGGAGGLGGPAADGTAGAAGADGGGQGGGAGGAGPGSSGGAGAGPGGAGGAGAPGGIGGAGGAGGAGTAGPAGAPGRGAGSGAPIGARASFTAITNPIWERLSELEKKMQKCCEEMNKTEGIVKDSVENFQDQIEGLMKQVATMGSDLSGGKLSPDLIKDLQGLMQLFQTVQEMQVQLNKVHETALQLATEKEERQSHTDALLEQIELLKSIKLDREDMVEAMAEKADLRMLARKVSHDQFELACDDLSRGLEHAVGKLNMQEELWQQALDDIQREIETKLDKLELGPVKEFFNTKLKQLQQNLKQMASLRREVEAAGTKRRLLRDVNCISCDADVVMDMDPGPNVPALPGLPPHHSMKPYLTYELDTIRKQQISNVPQRNMRDWEAIDKQAKHGAGGPGAPGGLGGPGGPGGAGGAGGAGGPGGLGGLGGAGGAGGGGGRHRSTSEKHLCNRYCGGSHTTTTPAQRVARLGHFIKQWGPDVLPLSSGYAAGDDGRLYKVTVDEPAGGGGPGGATDASCTARARESGKGEDAKIVTSARLLKGVDCRCLEGEPRP